MPWRSIANLGFLLAMACLLAAGNLWIAAARSTIPLRLDERVARKEIRREKHPGKDDVHLLHFDSGRVLHVDGPIYDGVEAGERLHKKAWSRQLDHDGQILQLEWSRDAKRMAWAMPCILAVMAFAAVAGWSVLNDSLSSSKESVFNPVR